MEKVIKKLIDKNKTISTMESCTGGYLASCITNVSGSSSVFKFGAVTYSNEYKINMGVDPNIINKYSVYSMETAIEMSRKICDFTNSDYGVGVTGKLNDIDPNNLYGKDNQVFVSIYSKDENKNYNIVIKVLNVTREENKHNIVLKIVEKLDEIIK